MAAKGSQQKEPLDKAVEERYLHQMHTVLPYSLNYSERPTKIFDFLFLGNEINARDTEYLRQIGITHVINTASGEIDTGQAYYGSDVKYLEFDADDCFGYDVIQHFPETFDFIEDARKSNGKALIHCVGGINRSGTLSVAYMMVHLNLGPITAAERLKKLRSTLLSNTYFQKLLVHFAHNKDLLRLDADRLPTGPLPRPQADLPTFR